MDRSHRRCVPLFGAPHATAARARALLCGIEPHEVLWVSALEPGGLRADELQRQLGRSVSALVLDLHGGLDADLFAMCHGFVRRGGAFVLRLPPRGEVPTGMDRRLAVWPHPAEAVGHRLWGRLVQRLAVPRCGGSAAAHGSAVEAVTDEQDALVARLVQAWSGEQPSATVLLARRGRGKSACLGRAVAAWAGSEVVVCAREQAAVGEVRRFAGAHAPPFVLPEELLEAPSPRVLLVDEAAQLSVPMLRALVERHAQAHLVFATTVEGYEGSGRGFRSRFLPWLAARRPVQACEPVVPLRWSAGDPVERLVDEVLAVAPASGLARGVVAGEGGGRAVRPMEVRSAGGAAEVAPVRYARLHPDQLAADDGLLGEVVGLLTEAHYRTTPSDLHRLLDAPNLELHAMLQRSRVVAVNLIAHEGGLPVGALTDRVRGHALAENLSSQVGRPDAAALRMVRSVRLAVHPDFRRAGLARRLTEAVHAQHAPDLFGTVFGATEEVIALRRGLGYELVRLGNGRGVRSGEPSAVMVRACSPAARELVEALRVELARDLPLQLDLLDADGPPHLEPSLRAALLEGLPAVPAREPAAQAALLAEYLAGRRTYEAAATAIEEAAAQAGLTGLRERERLLVELRVVQRLGWREVARRAGLPSVAATMRAVRAAVGAAVG